MSPIFTFDMDAFRGHLNWNTIVGTRCDVLPLYRSSIDEMRARTNTYIDDVCVKKEVMDTEGEIDVKVEEDEDVFNISQVD